MMPHHTAFRVPHLQEPVVIPGLAAVPGNTCQPLCWHPSPHLSDAAHLGRAGGCNVDLQSCRGLPLLHAGARGRTEKPHAACGDLHQLVAGHIPAQQRLQGRQQLCHCSTTMYSTIMSTAIDSPCVSEAFLHWRDKPLSQLQVLGHPYSGGGRCVKVSVDTRCS